MATVTLGEETIVRKFVSVKLSQEEARRVGARLQTDPPVLGDDGAQIGLQINQVAG